MSHSPKLPQTGLPPTLRPAATIARGTMLRRRSALRQAQPGCPGSLLSRQTGARPSPEL